MNLMLPWTNNKLLNTTQLRCQGVCGWIAARMGKQIRISVILILNSWFNHNFKRRINEKKYSREVFHCKFHPPAY